MTKAELQSELDKRGIAYTAKDTKPVLEALLDDAAPKKAARKIGKAVKPAYAVTVNGGNVPGAAITSLKELGAIAEKHLVADGARAVTIEVKALMTQGATGAERVDGVK